MEGEARREAIIELLNESRSPVSGSELARKMGVSRQVIVQDIALLRAKDKNILSTNKGYLLYEPNRERAKARRTIAVWHTDVQMQDELYAIVDCGGEVRDVVVEHDVYGQLTGDLILKNRQDVDEFIEKIKNSSSQSMLTLTGGLHFHTIEAETEQILDAIEKKLEEKGYLRRA